MISETNFLWLYALNRIYGLRDVTAVCDLGAQELNPVYPEVWDKTLRKFAEFCECPNADLADCRSSAELWRRLNREIVSIDMVGADPSVIKFDLNTDEVRPEHRSHFDLVTNYGTSEHVFNQFNCFRAMHDLTKPGGVIVHEVPSVGYENHGLYTYPIKFFWRLCRDNNYLCLDLWMSRDPLNATPKPDVSDFMWRSNFQVREESDHPVNFYRLARDEYRSSDGSIYAILKKIEDAPFQAPLDIDDVAAARG